MLDRFVRLVYGIDPDISEQMLASSGLTIVVIWLNKIIYLCVWMQNSSWIKLIFTSLDQCLSSNTFFWTNKTSIFFLLSFEHFQWNEEKKHTDITKVTVWMKVLHTFMCNCWNLIWIQLKIQIRISKLYGRFNSNLRHIY